MGVQVLFKSDKGTVVKQLIKNNYKKPCFYKNSYILSGWWFCDLNSIGVLRSSSTSSTRGTRISSMAIRTATIRTTQTLFAPLGLFNHLTI